MKPASLALLERFWIDELGCHPEDLASAKVTVVAHGTLAGYAGIYFFRHREALIISAPENLVAGLRGSLGAFSPDELFARSTIAQILGPSAQKVIGPAWIGGILPGDFAPPRGGEVRELRAADASAASALFAACTNEEVEHSSLEIGKGVLTGAFAGGALAALAGYERLFGCLAHIGVLSHPAHRGKGMAAAAIGLATELALKEELGIQYQTLLSNDASVRAAQRLGYREFARTIAVRLP